MGWEDMGTILFFIFYQDEMRIICINGTKSRESIPLWCPHVGYIFLKQNI